MGEQHMEDDLKGTTYEHEVYENILECLDSTRKKRVSYMKYGPIFIMASAAVFLLLMFGFVLVVLQLSFREYSRRMNVIKPIWRKYMKKLLGLFCVMVLAGCSSMSSNGGLFGGVDCEAKEARDFMANAEDRVFFALDSSALTQNAQEVLDTQVNWLTSKPRLLPRPRGRRRWRFRISFPG